MQESLELGFFVFTPAVPLLARDFGGTLSDPNEGLIRVPGECQEPLHFSQALSGTMIRPPAQFRLRPHLSGRLALSGRGAATQGRSQAGKEAAMEAFSLLGALVTTA